jgi:hypothetical protein
MMGLGMNSSDDELCYEEDEEEDVDHASPPKNNEQAGPSVPRTVTTADSVTKKRAPPNPFILQHAQQEAGFPVRGAGRRTQRKRSGIPFHGPARD